LESRTVHSLDHPEDEKPIVISTVHRAKGLEWRVVFIPMLCEDNFPSIRSIGDPDAYEEERRVFYVALTRAKDQLYLISPSIKQTRRGPQTVKLSQFVSELNPKVYTESSVQFKSKKADKIDKKDLFRSALDLL
jgi:DNA helicase-2/ATP-dependent DNA helicase PcrA